jgi:hypothetical protein
MQNRSVRDMPEHYFDQNYDLGATVLDLTITGDDDFYTVEACPLIFTDQINVMWKQWIFNPAYLSYTPHRTTSKTLSSRFETKQASLFRRGIASEFELDFATTPTGRFVFAHTLIAMSNATRETMRMEVIRQLIRCQDSQIQWLHQYGIITQGDVEAYLDRYFQRFMCIQKDEKGFAALNTQIDTDMDAYQSKANMWICGREISNYCNIVPDIYTSFDKGGERAVSRFLQMGDAGGAPRPAGGTGGRLKRVGPQRDVAGIPVYITSAYQHEGGAKVEILSRWTEVGVWNLMANRDIGHYSSYTSVDRRIRVYSNKSDTWKDIDLKDAVENCFYWDRIGNIDEKYQKTNRKTVDPDDFLVRGNGQTIQCFGDMRSKFLPTTDLQRGAETLLSYIVRSTGKTDSEVKQALDSNDATGRNEVVNKLKRWLIEGAADISAELTVEAAPTGGSSSSSARSESQSSSLERKIESNTYDLFTKYLGATLKNPSKQSLVEKIARDNTKPIESRASELKKLIQSEMITNPDSVTIGNTKLLDEYFTKTLEKFHENNNQDVAQLKQLQSQIRSANIRVPIGRPMPYGFKPVGKQTTPSGNDIAAKRPELVENIRRLNESGCPDWMAFLGAVYAMIKIQKDVFLTLVALNIYLAMHFLLIRNECLYKTRYMIKMQGQGESGNTFIGHGNMMLQHEAGRKNGMMHFTVMIGVVIHTPKNVHVVQDAFCMKYGGGMGVTFWKSADEYRTNSRQYRDIKCVMIPPSRVNINPRIDARGRWYTLFERGYCSNEQFASEIHFEGADRLARMCGWATDGSNIGFESFSSGMSAGPRGKCEPNFICGRGVTGFFTTNASGKPVVTDWELEDSVFGNQVCPGHGKLRNGEYVKPPTYDFGSRIV